ncbi:hypothetical protein AGRA3207_003488 [Actinomadura graeca]|uniref:Lantibiotic n=1 Tax=Actinomadura graeca TaxID=2750812 RepID=A0ABX8QUK4_9ACTN|nr:hypothetical protein [Actinomadura graeca]QXJ22484.1 hypothetical protein AGRA3207_003488 [Actinomadura graeca]
MPVNATEGTTTPGSDMDFDADFDLDIDSSVITVTTGPSVTSHAVCTPGCTSPGGGSFCSWCCC